MVVEVFLPCNVLDHLIIMVLMSKYNIDPTQLPSWIDSCNDMWENVGYSKNRKEGEKI